MTPPGLPKKGGKVGKGLAIVVVLAVLAFVAIPSLRHTATRTYDKIFAKPHAIALAAASVRNHGICPAPILGQDNATLYWYTHPANGARESVTVTLAPSFTGSVTSVVFTPLIANPTTTLAGRPSPHPVAIKLIAEPSNTTTIIRLKDPPVLQSVSLSVPRATSITLQLLSSDAGSARSTCAETGVVFEGKNT
jgi:hypothetical protein